MEQLWRVALGVAGMGAIASFIVWSLYRQWLRLPIFQQMTREQQYNLFKLFIILTFTFGMTALFVHALTQGSTQTKTELSRLGLSRHEKGFTLVPPPSEPLPGGVVQYEAQRPPEKKSDSPLSLELVNASKLNSDVDRYYDIYLRNDSSEDVVINKVLISSGVRGGGADGGSEISGGKSLIPNIKYDFEFTYIGNRQQFPLPHPYVVPSRSFAAMRIHCYTSCATTDVLSFVMHIVDTRGRRLNIIY